MSRLFLGTALLVAISTTYAGAADTLVSLKQGDPIGAFEVTKVAGAEDDGVEAGETLCYRCRYGSGPMVMVFARDGGEKLAMLVKELDSATKSNANSPLKSFVTLLGSDRESLKQQAEKIVSASGAKNIPVTIANDTEHGPVAYKISEDAEVTVIVANDSQVVATHTFKAAGIDTAKIMSDIKQLFN